MDSFERYYIAAIRHLTRRPRSQKEIRDYLKKKKAPEDVITAVITKLKEQKFQNDIEFSRWWVEQRTRFKSKSNRIIRLELREKGIADDIIKMVISEETETSKSEYDKALLLANKYVKRIENLPRNDKYQRIGAFLSRKGFDFDTSRRVIDDILEKSYNTD